MILIINLFQERVDDWMSNLCKNMSLKPSIRINNNLNTGPSLKVSRPATNRLMKAVLEMNKKKADTENEQLLKRIRQREREEARKERELILKGKVQPTLAQIRSDKILQIYERVKTIEQKSKENADSKQRKTSKAAKKWQNAVAKIKIPTTPYKSVPMFPDEDDENVPKVRKVGVAYPKPYNEEEDTMKLINKNIGVTSDNPIHKSFAAAKDVDELYKIAEYWLSPSR